MKRIFISTLSGILAFIFIISCNDKSASGEEMAINNMFEQFPQLPQSTGGKHTDFYRLERTVIMGDKNIKLRLYSMDKNIDDPQSIITIENPKGVCAAIPFFSNRHRDYWNFEFDEPIPGKEKVNSTFEKEFNMAVEKLKLNTDEGLQGLVLEEIMISLLHCRQIEECDSTAILYEIPMDHPPYNSIPKEKSDSCQLRKERNFAEIMKGVKRAENFFYLNAFWDKKNNRIYQFVNMGEIRGNINSQIKLKNYRQDCVLYLLIM